MPTQNASRAAVFAPPAMEPGRDADAVGQQKTLRCGECGTMNYPTEWYCERCGAELSAL